MKIGLAVPRATAHTETEPAHIKGDRLVVLKGHTCALHGDEGETVLVKRIDMADRQPTASHTQHKILLKNKQPIHSSRPYVIITIQKHYHLIYNMKLTKQLLLPIANTQFIRYTTPFTKIDHSYRQ